MWNPFIFSGTPYLADIQTALFYPPNWIYFLINPARGIVYYILLHYFLAGFFAFLFLRKLDFERFACLAGAIFYAFSGFMILHTIHLNMIAGYALIPLALLLTHNLTRKINLLSASLLGLVLGIHILAGAPQMSLFLYIIVFVYFAGQLSVRDLFQKNQIRLVGLFVLAVIISILLASIQVAPTFEFYRNTFRSESINFTDATKGSLTLKDTLLFVVPDYMGHPLVTKSFSGNTFYWEECFYVGIFPLILTLIGIFISPLREKRRLRIFVFIGILGFLFALGNNTPIYLFFYKFLPFFKSFRAPIRFLLFPLLSMTYFITLAIDQLPDVYASVNKKMKTVTFSIVSIMTIITVVLSLLLLRIPHIPSKAGLVFFVTTGFAGIFLVLLSIYGALKGNAVRFTAIAILVVSAFSFGFTWKPTAPGNYYEKKTALFAHLQNKFPPERVHYYPPLKFKDTLNLPSTKNLSNIIGYNPLALSRYLDFLIYSDFEIPIDNKLKRSLARNGNIFGMRKIDNKMIELLNLTINFRTADIKGNLAGEAIPVAESGPRAFVVPEYRVVRDKMKTLEILRSPGFDYSKKILLHEKPQLKGFETAAKEASATSSSDRGVQFVEYSPDRMKIRVNPTRNCWLFLSEIYYPGWKAKVDGEQRKVFRANYTFRAIPLKRGEREVEVYFKPDSVKIGALVTVATFIFLVLSWCLPVLMKKENGR
ncbi:MAG: YfhO family protein [Candidatus Eremiobacteraeota bacterium]|nr:YfhO family protein [Candidatus Eremiobacteraeota bacterium]